MLKISINGEKSKLRCYRKIDSRGREIKKEKRIIKN